MNERRRPSCTVPSLWPTDGSEVAPHCGTAHGAVSAAVAAYALGVFTTPGDLVFDPDCGPGTAVTTAVQEGRHAVGLATNQCCWSTARRRLNLTKAQGAAPDGMILAAGRATLRTQLAGLTGRVDLVLTAMHRRTDLRSICDRLRLSRDLLRPDAFAVVAIQTRYEHGTRSLLDVPAMVADDCAAAGFVVVARCLAYTPPDPVGSRMRLSPSEPTHQTILVMQVAQATGRGALAQRRLGPAVSVGFGHARVGEQAGVAA